MRVQIERVELLRCMQRGRGKELVSTHPPTYVYVVAPSPKRKLSPSPHYPVFSMRLTHFQGLKPGAKEKCQRERF